MSYKLGSLFDGSGGFPLSGALCGVEPCWAAEVEPYPIAVTRTRFPHMRHLGDISKINGADIEPVDIITFGSPCQDLSVAGKGAGIKHATNGDEETTRSGLFMEAVRIIKEMRQATNGKYPTFALWENVPGAFSSNKGEDFRIVLEELIKIVEPTASMPSVPSGGWAYADSYVGDGWSLAYRVFDAQYWGVAQRRRRIHLVLDLGGQRAREVLFEREGLRGYFTQSGAPWQTTPADAQGCTGADDCQGETDGGLDAVAYTVDQGAGKSLCYVLKDQSPTLSCSNDGAPAVALPYMLKIRSGCAVDANGKSAGKGALIQTDKAATLSTVQDQYLFQPVTGIIDNIGGQAEYAKETAINGTLRAGTLGAVAYSIENHPADSRVNIDDSGKVQTLTSRMGTGGGNVPMVMEPKAICLQGNGIDRADTAGCNGKGVKEDVAYTLNTIDRHAVAYTVDEKMGNTYTWEEQANTLAARDYKQPQAVAYTEGQCITAENSHYIVRRLTPTECARLQGFPDRWGDIDEKDAFTDEEYRFWLDVRNTHAAINDRAVKDYTMAQMLTWYNKLHTDSAEYKMWGNGIALPPALYVLQGMVYALSIIEEDDAWMT